MTIEVDAFEESFYDKWEGDDCDLAEWSRRCVPELLAHCRRLEKELSRRATPHTEDLCR